MLIKCPECGSDVSPKAVTCPKCGHPLKSPPPAPQYSKSPTPSPEYRPPKKGNIARESLSKCLLISFILGIAYLLYSIFYWSGAVGSGTTNAEQIGRGLAVALVMPHLAFTALAVIFNALGLFMKKRGFALTGAILYSVALVLFLPYFMFVIIEMILSYVGFAKMSRY